MSVGVTLLGHVRRFPYAKGVCVVLGLVQTYLMQVQFKETGKFGPCQGGPVLVAKSRTGVSATLLSIYEEVVYRAGYVLSGV